jgi:magnesium transporter
MELTGQSGAIGHLLGYADQTAGRIMTPNVFALDETVTAGEAVATLQRLSGPEVVFYLYVIDDRHHLVGVTSLRRLVLVPADTPLSRIMTTDVVSVSVDARQDEAARLVASYNLLALPVVDAENKLVGVITVDDVIDVIRDETTRDIQRIGGLEALDEPYMRTPFWTLVQKRGRWLVVLFLGEMLTATAMAHYEDKIAHAVVLALFVPLILSCGGNSGSQAASLMIRALAVGEVTLTDWWMVMRRELTSGLALGAILGVVGFLRVTLWANVGHIYGPHWLLIAFVIGLSLIGVVMWGTLTGAMLPFVMKRLGADPAASSAPFVATLVDVTGLVIYFSVAELLLSGTLL